MDIMMETGVLLLCISVWDRYLNFRSVQNLRMFILLLKFRKWFKYGLKAQKLLAQGIALGILAVNKAPCKGKSIVICLEF